VSAIVAQKNEKLKAAQSVFLIKSRSSLKDGNLSMYTLESPDLYPDDRLADSQSPVSTRKVIHNPRIPKNAAPLGFCCGGFSSTADYASATKLNLR
jgi:hypothetical protein